MAPGAHVTIEEERHHEHGEAVAVAHRAEHATFQRRHASERARGHPEDGAAERADPDPLDRGELRRAQAKGTKLATDATNAGENLKAYKASISTLSASRLAFDLELHTLKALVENNATSGSDVTGMGFVLLTLPTGLGHAPPEPPASLLVRLSKQHGKASVTVAGKGYQGSFVAEASTDPIGTGTWSSLPGTGKQRKLAGYPSGTKLWVHFASIRFGAQSAWSAPVLVVIP